MIKHSTPKKNLHVPRAKEKATTKFAARDITS
jgi:hypothetical protein